jgi:hypothetical protein
VGSWSEYVANVKSIPRAAWESLVRHGPPITDRSRAEAVFQNLFLHIHSTRVHRWSLRWSYTMGLGLICAASFVALTVTGVLLMFYYKPSTALAYQSIKDIHYVVPTGRFMRNIHRWGAHLMVIAVILHMARVFFTASYKKPREMNWVFGIVLLILTLALSFSGYLLPWDQLAYWAVTIGANIAQVPGRSPTRPASRGTSTSAGSEGALLLGSRSVGEDADPVLRPPTWSFSPWRWRFSWGCTSGGSGRTAACPGPRTPTCGWARRRRTSPPSSPGRRGKATGSWPWSGGRAPTWGGGRRTRSPPGLTS